MIRKLCLSGIFLVIFSAFASCQNYDAKGYWKMEHDSHYGSLSSRQSAGDSLSAADLSYLEGFRKKLAAYFEKMPDEEKASYYKNRTAWNSNKPGTGLVEEDQVYSGERSTFTKYVISSGIWGAFYGSSLIYIFDMSSPSAAGIPLITGGVGALIPMLSSKDKKVSTNSLLLSLHGKSIGAFQGYALSALLMGDNIGKDNGDKISTAIAVGSSIALGRVGFNLGRSKTWSQGRVSLYSHYGWLFPLEGIALVTALNIDNPRVSGLASLAGGFAGYYLANRVSDRISFTRGDVISVSTFTWLNAYLGFAIISNASSNSSALSLVPASLAMAGTIAGQSWMKGANLTNQQGRNVALATAAGTIIGFGADIVMQIEDAPAVYIIPYVTGLLSYSIIAQVYKHDNTLKTVKPQSESRFHFNFMPQNILLNNRLASSGRTLPGNRMSLLPAFSASISF